MISILLPYKENYSPHYAGAVSLFVKDITKVSTYKKNIMIFGNLEMIQYKFYLYFEKSFYLNQD